MISRGKAMALVAVAAFIAILLYGTLASQRVVCTVDVDFRGASNSATASAESEQAAAQRAQETACGPITAGMNDRIACAEAKPIRRVCRPA